MLVFTKRQRALLEIQRRRNDRATYVTPLPADADDDVLEENHASDLQTYERLKAFYEELVPEIVSEDEFWQRYYYRTGSLDRVVEELNETTLFSGWSNPTSSNTNKENNIETTRTKKDALLLDAPNKDQMMQRFTSSPDNSTTCSNDITRRRPRESLGPASLFSFVLPQMSKIQHTELLPPDLVVAPTVDSSEDNNPIVETKDEIEPTIQEQVKENDTVDEEITEPISPIAAAFQAMFPKNQRRAKSMGGVNNKIKQQNGTARTSLSPSALRNSTQEEPHAEPPINSIVIVKKQTTRMPHDDPQQDTNEPTNSDISLIPLFLSFLILMIAYLATTDYTPFVRQGLCAPYIPGLKLPGRTFAVEAPWWAPGRNDVCEAHTRLEWDETPSGVFRLTMITTTRNKKKKRTVYKRLRSVRILVNEIVLEQHDGKLERIAAPWKL